MNDKLMFRLIIAVSVFVFAVVFILQNKVLNIFPDKTVIPSWVFFFTSTECPIKWDL